jgi:thiosulfate/3-mercaptopyruvate sulfurtransferase
MIYSTLITTAELAPHLDDPRWVIFDCRFTLTDPDAGRHAYAIGHIPGARYAHLNDDLSAPLTSASGRHPLPAPKELAEKLGRWGVDRTKQVVVYDASFGAIAARMWWLLHWLGHKAVAVLDGDLRRWEKESRPITRDPPDVTPTQFHPTLHEDLWVDVGHVERMVVDSAGLLMDARSEERFKGEVEPLDPVAGHIPGAVSVPFEDNLELDGTFLSREALGERYRALLGEKHPRGVVHMCGSGVTACHNLLAMEHAGLRGARLYAGSWSEWIRDPNHPIVTGS